MMGSIARRRSNRLPVLADEIKHHLADAQRQAGASLASSIEAGRRLIEAQQELRKHGYGLWQEWLAENFALSERTANLLMQIAREVPKLPEADQQRVADLSLRAAAKLLAKKRAKGPVIEPPPITKPDTVTKLKTEKDALEARLQESDAAYQLIKQERQLGDEANGRNVTSKSTKSACDIDDDEEFDPPEDVNYQLFMGISHGIMEDARRIRSFKDVKSLPEMLHTAQKVAAAWDEVVKDFEQRLSKTLDQDR